MPLYNWSAVKLCQRTTTEPVLEEHLMSDHRQLALDYVQEHKTHSLEKMKQIVSIPSVSTDPERAGDI